MLDDVADFADCFAALNQTRKLGLGSKLYHRGVICAFAGFLALSALNLLLVMVLGTKHNPGTSTHQKGQQNTSYQGVQGAQTYGTTSGPVVPSTAEAYSTPATMV